METEVKVSYKLQNVDISSDDYKQWTGELVAVDPEDGYTKKLKVSISAMLAERIRNQRENPSAFQYENVWFTSTEFSDRFEENPLMLIKFVKKDGSFNNFHVKIVSEGKKIKRVAYNLFQRRVEAGVRNRRTGKQLYSRIPPHLWRRYAVYQLTS